MIVSEDSNNYVLVLKRGEKLVQNLESFAVSRGIEAAWLSALGAVLQAELAYYDLEKKEYQYHKLDETLEIASLSGNIALFEGKPTLHAHVVLADQNLKTYGGHLKEATIGGTCEVYLKLASGQYKRKQDGGTGLKLLDL